MSTRRGKVGGVLAFLLILAMFVTLIVMLTLQIAGVIVFHGATWIAVPGGATLLLLGIAGITGRRRTSSHSIYTSPHRKDTE